MFIGGKKEEGADSRRDAIFLSDLLLAVDVDLREGDLGRAREACGELFVNGGDLLAWSAPVGVDCIVESLALQSDCSIVALLCALKPG